MAGSAYTPCSSYFCGTLDTPHAFDEACVCLQHLLDGAQVHTYLSAFEPAMYQATGPTALGFGGGYLGYRTQSFGYPFIQNKVVSSHALHPNNRKLQLILTPIMCICACSTQQPYIHLLQLSRRLVAANVCLPDEVDWIFILQ